jgi:hypothetical protein
MVFQWKRYRAAISTLLATAEFVRSSAETLQVLSGVHPREGILLLTPFSALRRVAMCGNASEVCRMSILAGLPALREVVAAGYGEYVVEGLPASVERLNMQWAHIASSFATIHFVVPGGCSLRELALSAQRPVCLDASSLARCAVLRLSARRVYLGLPLRRGAPWADVDELAARWAQFMLASPLEAVEVTATRCFIFQPVQGALGGGQLPGWQTGCACSAATQASQLAARLRSVAGEPAGAALPAQLARWSLLSSKQRSRAWCLPCLLVGVPVRSLPPLFQAVGVTSRLHPSTPHQTCLTWAPTTGWAAWRSRTSWLQCCWPGTSAPFTSSSACWRWVRSEPMCASLGAAPSPPPSPSMRR